jgi:hypothetical protein
MGASGSIPSADQGAELMASMAKQYEAYKATGKSDEEISQLMSNLYSSLVTSMGILERKPKTTHASDSSHKTTALGSPNKRKFVRRPTAMGASPKKSVAPRRRSFGQVDENSANKEKKMTGFESVPTLPGSPVAATEQQVDSWDSIAQQPSCAVCNMVFQTQGKLDRHIRYSDLHAKTLAAKDKAILERENQLVEKEPAAQVEGVDYRLMYSGSKFFWRTNDTVDIHIYYHTLSGTYEVISFDVNRHKEFNRVYLNNYPILTNLEEAVIKEVSAKLKASDQKDKGRFTSNVAEVDKAAMLDEARRYLTQSFILERLKLDVSGNTKSVSFVQLSKDTSDPSQPVLLAERPSVLVPVSVARRRRTTTEDVNTAFADFKETQKQLQDATSRAEKMSGLINQSISGFKNVLARRRSTMKFGSSETKWAKLWRWAIRRIMLQNIVADYMHQWQAWEEKWATGQGDSNYAVTKMVKGPVSDVGGAPSKPLTRRPTHKEI